MKMPFIPDPNDLIGETITVEVQLPIYAPCIVINNLAPMLIDLANTVYNAMDDAEWMRLAFEVRINDQNVAKRRGGS